MSPPHYHPSPDSCSSPSDNGSLRKIFSRGVPCPLLFFSRCRGRFSGFYSRTASGPSSTWPVHRSRRGSELLLCLSVCPPRERLLLRNRRSIFPGAVQEAPCCPTLGVTERACEREAIGRLKLVPGVPMTFSPTFFGRRRSPCHRCSGRWFGGSVAHDTREIQDGREGCKDALSYARPARHGKRKRGSWR